jgi:hypothetical protein
LFLGISRQAAHHHRLMSAVHPRYL